MKSSIPDQRLSNFIRMSITVCSSSNHCISRDSTSFLIVSDFVYRIISCCGCYTDVVYMWMLSPRCRPVSARSDVNDLCSGIPASKHKQSQRPPRRGAAGAVMSLALNPSPAAHVTLQSARWRHHNVCWTSAFTQCDEQPCWSVFVSKRCKFDQSISLSVHVSELIMHDSLCDTIATVIKGQSYVLGIIV